MQWIWWIISITALIIEFATPGGLISIWFCIGGIVAGLLAYLGINFIWQVVCFFVFSIIAVILLRPVVKKYFIDSILPLNADRFVGQSFTLLSDCSKEKWGEIDCNGQIWHCVSNNHGKLMKGSKVVVIAIEGAKFIVEEDNRGNIK